MTARWGLGLLEKCTPLCILKIATLCKLQTNQYHPCRFDICYVYIKGIKQCFHCKQSELDGPIWYQCLWYEEMKPLINCIKKEGKKGSITASKMWKYTRDFILIPYSSPIDWSVEINQKPNSLLNGDVFSRHLLIVKFSINFKSFVFLAVYWSIWTSLNNTDIKVQQVLKLILHNV